MTNSVQNVNPQMKFTPNTHYVANPPERVYRFSVYDELHLNEDKYKEIKSALSKPSEGNVQRKRKSMLKKVITAAVLIGLGVLSWKNRTWICEKFRNLKDKIPQMWGKK